MTQGRPNSAIVKPARGYDDGAILIEMGLGIIGGRFQSVTEAARSLGGNDESNIHRLCRKYRDGEYHGKALAVYTEEVVRSRGLTPRPEFAEPTELRKWLIGELGVVIDGYASYSRMLGARTDCQGDRFMFEDYLFDWDRHLTPREAAEQRFTEAAAGIRSFFESNLIRKEHGVDEHGITCFYPEMHVGMTIDPGKASQDPDLLSMVEPGVYRGEDITIVYKNPTVREPRYLETEHKRYLAEKETSEHYLREREWAWPEQETTEARC